MTIQEAKTFGVKKLTSSPSKELDVSVLLQHILKRDKTYILFHKDYSLSDAEEKVFVESLEKRNTGLPVAYITGHKEFFGYDFTVTPDVLIPKPDTELLVEKTIEALEEKAAVHGDRIFTVCDMCTGSGCVGLSVFKYITENNIIKRDFLPTLVLADISERALSIAKENARNLLGPAYESNIKFLHSNLFEMTEKKFDVITSNPPYVPYKESLELLEDGRNEPLLALNGDVDLAGNNTNENTGLGIIRNLILQAKEHLNPCGTLLVESGEYNAEETKKIFVNAGFMQTRIYKDLNDQLRVTAGNI